MALGVRVASRWACYSWRLPPPRWIGGNGLLGSTRGDCAVLRRRICEGYVLTPRGSQRATLVERVIELPHLCVVSLAVPLRGIGFGSHKPEEPPKVLVDTTRT